MSYLTQQQLKQLGFKHLGENVQISDKASIYNAANISIGNNTRIDDFCILSAGNGGIIIGNYIHIGCFTSLIGGGKILLEDYCNISGKVSIYSSNDDYSGKFMTNPTIPKEFTNVVHQDVIIKKHVIVGSGSVVLPGVVINEGVAIGALSLVNKSCDSFSIYGGVPIKRLNERSKDLLLHEKRLAQQL